MSKMTLHVILVRSFVDSGGHMTMLQRLDGTQLASIRRIRRGFEGRLPDRTGGSRRRQDGDAISVALVSRRAAALVSSAVKFRVAAGLSRYGLPERSCGLSR